MPTAISSQAACLPRLAQTCRSVQRRLVEPHAGVAVALDHALDLDEEIGPDGLRAGVAAPDAADDGR